MDRRLRAREERFAGSTVADRGGIEVPGTGVAWVDERGDAPAPEYTRQTLPRRRMALHLDGERRTIRYAGPFIDGVVLVEEGSPSNLVAMLLERLTGPVHAVHNMWRLCELSAPVRTAWVRADGKMLPVVRDTDSDDPMWDELLRGEDIRDPMRPVEYGN